MKPEKWISYEDRVTRVTAYVHDHLDDPLDLDTLAGIAAFSPHHWHRIYRAIRGETIADTVRRLRLQRAASALAYTGEPVEAIARRAGYGSAQAFTRAFSDSHGMAPARYRDEGSHKDFTPQALDAPRRNWSIRFEQVPARTMLAIEHRGPYMAIERGFEALFGRASAQGLLPAEIRLVGLFHDDPTLVPEEALRSHAMIPLLDPDAAVAPPLERLTVAPGEYAVLRHQGPYTGMRAAYDWLFGTWLPQSGREAADAPVLEDYLNDPSRTPPGELLTDLYLLLQ